MRDKTLERKPPAIFISSQQGGAVDASRVAFAPTGQSSYVIIANSRVIGQTVYKTAGWCNGLKPVHVRDMASDELPDQQWVWESLIDGQEFPYFIDQENLRQAIADHLNSTGKRPSGVKITQ